MNQKSRNKSRIVNHTFNFCTKFVGSPGIIHDHTPDCPPISWVWTDDIKNERSVDSQDTSTWVIDVLNLLFDMLSIGVCTTRHWQTSGRLVQELNVCAVHYSRVFHVFMPALYVVLLQESWPPLLCQAASDGGEAYCPQTETTAKMGP